MKIGGRIEGSYSILELGGEFDPYYQQDETPHKIFALGSLMFAKLFVAPNKSTQRFKVYAVCYYKEKEWKSIKPVNMTLQFVKGKYKDYYFRPLSETEKTKLWTIVL